MVVVVFVVFYGSGCGGACGVFWWRVFVVVVVDVSGGGM